VSSSWARRLTRWWDHEHQGVRHSLAHLHPFRFITALPQSDKYLPRTVEIRVGFSCHTFTRERASGDSGATPYLARDTEIRMFCPDRHALSKLLPDIVRSLPSRDCFYAKQQNYFVVELPNTLPPGEEYRVFFNVRKVDVPDAVLVFVQSAYAAGRGIAPSGITRKKVGFRVLLNLALQGRRPVPPP
jgi:hypothetical protein